MCSWWKNLWMKGSTWSQGIPAGMFALDDSTLLSSQKFEFIARGEARNCYIQLLFLLLSLPSSQERTLRIASMYNCAAAPLKFPLVAFPYIRLAFQMFKHIWAWPWLNKLRLSQGTMLYSTSLFLRLSSFFLRRCLMLCFVHSLYDASNHTLLCSAGA